MPTSQPAVVRDAGTHPCLGDLRHRRVFRDLSEALARGGPSEECRHSTCLHSSNRLALAADSLPAVRGTTERLAPVTDARASVGGRRATISPPTDRSPLEKTVLQHVALILTDVGRICVRCLASDADVAPDDVMQHIQVIAATITTTVDYGSCGVCGRQDNVLSFAE
jgi:hypothetical protein